ncbi:DNA (cytosine-5-)-methyltransferase [Bacteroides graminisolvens]|jgi:DNA (cytosine-5)-methyltransferase 1|uniref:DNA (cytosine-5-)-methyltransferase n=1 Tax=Bacteroides graminisolvens TaxID=477666 RepID=UPI0023F5044B|nr:DNA (cytosine-5-)-methyltransferase [Bacteroides graminisolvens]MDD3211713.1 DNA (cytosine-5-)-methyltransferase [Bacteroides graminisolvens]
MAKVKYDIENQGNTSAILSEAKSTYGLQTYISLFSSAGIGCYGFKEEGFYCIATVELLERRLKIQSYNHKCVYNSGYICGDMTMPETKEKIFSELDFWKKGYNITDLDVLIATPPCQGMSVANHKKKDELKRNSLVVESIKMTKQIKPKFFIYENVRAFLNSICTDIDGKDKSIKEAIDTNLSGDYNILYQVLNFKDYGNPSSRTRTLVIGVRKDLKEITPFDIFPDKQQEKTLKQVIGHLPSLTKMGEISDNDIYHNFRKYSPHMEAWIADIKEGQSAFDNTDPSKIPHTVKDGVMVYNANKNGDKYTRQYWNKVAPCIHTRNDILASQNTVHPTDNRVFSIREIMLMMSVPTSFMWSDIPFNDLNTMSDKLKREFLKKEEINIRQNLGEAVPTVIFRQIAHKIRRFLCKPTLSEQDIKGLIEKKSLTTQSCLLNYIKHTNHYNFAELSKISELANALREDNSAYYTRQDICYSIIKHLPDPKDYIELNILEPSIGVGNFLPTLIQKYSSVQTVNIDVVDIDIYSIEILKELVSKIKIPSNIHISYINEDFLLYNFDKKYDIIVGNPPYKKITKEKDLLSQYKAGLYNKDTNNIFSFFIEKAMKIGNVVSLIVPKSLINAPEFNATRSLMKEKQISHIIDFGEKGFKGVKIETISFILNTQKKPQNTIVESYITDEVKEHKQTYLMDSTFPYWIIYRNDEFDEVVNKMKFNVFKAYRDRVITKAITKKNGKIRVLKSRNIGNNGIINIPEYDSYIDDIDGLDVAKYLNQTNCVLLPNLTYNPRACFLPKGCIADGSVAILTLTDNTDSITKADLDFYATDSFTKFYAIARNLGTRSLNIDNNSVFFFGKLKQ